jgi:peptidyl-prolyl cis-trans isomerase D
LSFAVWGINDIFRGFGRSTVAKIGGTEIPIEQFRRAYNERLQQIARQLGHPLAPEQAKALGLDRQVLGEMVAEVGLDQRARQMRLAVSDAEIVRRITVDPALQTPTGQFDRMRFEQFLRNAGYSEQLFVAEQRRATLRRQIIDSLSGELPVPNAWLEAINQFQNQERGIEYRRWARRRRATFRNRPPMRSTSISRRAKSCSGRRNTARSRLSRWCRWKSRNGWRSPTRTSNAPSTNTAVAILRRSVDTSSRSSFRPCRKPRPPTRA